MTSENTQDKFTVHTDKVDPRTDPMGHLIHDAQEVLIGLAGAAISGAAIGSYIYKIKKILRIENSKQ